MQTVFKIGALITLACLAAGPLSAEPRYAVDKPALQLVQRDCPSLSDAIERVRREYKGRILGAETHRRGNREVHHIKVLTDDGKVKTVRIPGCSTGSRG